MIKRYGNLALRDLKADIIHVINCYLVGRNILLINMFEVGELFALIVFDMTNINVVAVEQLFCKGIKPVAARALSGFLPDHLFFRK
jgi:hypothetical protein